MARPFRRSLLVYLGVLSLAAGCRDLLGINEAEFDPGLGRETGAGASGGDAATGGGGESGAENVAGQGGATGDSDGGAGQGGDSSSGATNADDGGAGGSDEPPPPLPLCHTYCTTITANCTGAHAQYVDFDTCLAVCNALPEGSLDSGKSNTVRCRLTQAERAGEGAAFYFCPKAGPSGGGECGSSCDGYCSVMMTFCTSASTSGQHFYSGFGGCRQACRQVPLDDDPYSVSLHSTGPHLQCRLFHASAAAANPVNECAAAMGSPPCESPD